MDGGTVFSWGIMALLNLAVAWLIFWSRPKGAANWIAAILIGTNTLFAVKQMLVIAGKMQAGDEFGQAVDAFLAPPPFVAFMVFPFFFPRRRLSARWEKIVLAGAAGLILLNWAWLFGGFWLTGQLTLANAYYRPPFALTLYLPFFLGLAVGTILLFDTYLSSPSRIQRDQARFVLAAYLLKVGTFMSLIVPNVLERWDHRFPPSPYIGLYIAAAAIVSIPIITIAYALVRSRLRQGPAGAEARTWREDAFVVAALAIGLSLAYSPESTLLELEYMLLRPLLFAYAILQYQLLDIDIRRFRLTVGTIAVTAIAALFIDIVREFRVLHVDADAALGISLAATLALTWLLLQPLLVRATQPSPAGDPRGRLLYRAALETALGAKPEHLESQAALLRAMRGRLGISEREHAGIEAAVRAILGAPVGRLEPGQMFLGHYRIVRPLGEGGFGATFLARDETIDRDVVIKATRATDAEAARRALREARAVAKLRHPNIVTLYHVDEVAGQVYLVMENLERGSLADALQKGPLGSAASTPIFIDVLSGLEAAHRAGLVHGDVKPANILLGADGTAKLADFGIAQALTPGTATATALTVPRAAGSLHYMAPEQVRGLGADARSDLYAWAASWQEAITGRHYLDKRAAGDFDLRVAIVGQKVRAAAVPAPLRDVLLACLAKDPSDRPASAHAVRVRLQAIGLVAS